MRRSLFLRRLLRPPHQAAAADGPASRLAPPTGPAAAPDAHAAHAPDAAALLDEALARMREGGTAEGTNLVAYSGGVDSSLVAALLFRAYPRNSFACIGTPPCSLVWT